MKGVLNILKGWRPGAKGEGAVKGGGGGGMRD